MPGVNGVDDDVVSRKLVGECADDLAAGQLVQIILKGPGPGLLPMQAIYKAEAFPVRPLDGYSIASAPLRICGWEIGSD